VPDRSRRKSRFIEIHKLLRAPTLGTLALLLLASPRAHAGTDAGAPVAQPASTGSVLAATPTPAAHDAGAPPAAAASGQPDSQAEAFVGRCSGCHTFGGGPLKGPDLLPSAQKPLESLLLMVKKMEANVGKLSDDDVKAFVAFIQDPAARERVEAERRRVAQAMAAKLEPPSISIGRALFFGEQALAGGGPACVACHRVRGEGGALGPDLTNLGRKLDRLGMASAIEQASFPVMRPTYMEKKIGKQESIHLAAFFETQVVPDRPPPVGAAPWAVPAAGMAGVGYAVLVGLTRRGRARGARARLVREAMRR
jgi:mono/diheme cytochrome c family protein